MKNGHFFDFFHYLRPLFGHLWPDYCPDFETLALKPIGLNFEPFSENRMSKALSVKK